MANLTAPSASWENRGPAAAAALLHLFVDDDGDWAVTDDPSQAAEGFFAEDGGELVIDDAAGTKTPIRLGSDTVVL